MTSRVGQVDNLRRIENPPNRQPQEPPRPGTNPRFPWPFLEFFAGGGMARLGLGPRWRCVFANETSEKKAQAYREEFSPWPELHVEDVSRLRAAALPDTDLHPMSYNDAYHVAGDGLAVPCVAWLEAHPLLPLAEAIR
jgi:hypothetical protein